MPCGSALAAGLMAHEVLPGSAVRCEGSMLMLKLTLVSEREERLNVHN